MYILVFVIENQQLGITLKITKFHKICLILYCFGEFIFDIVYIQSYSAKGLCSQ